MKKERVVYVVEDGKYIGHTLKMPILVHADSFEKMSVAIKELAVHWHNRNAEILNQEQPFEFIKQPPKQ